MPSRPPLPHEELLIAIATRRVSEAVVAILPEVAPIVLAAIAKAIRQEFPAVLDRAASISAVRQGVAVRGPVRVVDKP